MNPCPATGLALSAVKVETIAKIPTEGFDFPAEARLGPELETLEPTAPWKTAPDIRRTHIAEQGESNAKVYGSILPFVPVCKSSCAAQQQVPCTAKHQGVRLLCAAPSAVKSTVSELSGPAASTDYACVAIDLWGWSMSSNTPTKKETYRWQAKKPADVVSESSGLVPSGTTAKGQVSVLTGPVLAAVSVEPCGSAPWQQAGYKHLSRHKAHAPPEGEKSLRVVPSDVQLDLERGKDKHLLGEYTEKKKHTNAFCTWSTQSRESANGMKPVAIFGSNLQAKPFKETQNQSESSIRDFREGPYPAPYKSDGLLGGQLGPVATGPLEAAAKRQHIALTRRWDVVSESSGPSPTGPRAAARARRVELCNHFDDDNKFHLNENAKKQAPMGKRLYFR